MHRNQKTESVAAWCRYQLQIPYPEYPKYEEMGLQQEALIQLRHAKDRLRVGAFLGADVG